MGSVPESVPGTAGAVCHTMPSHAIAQSPIRLPEDPLKQQGRFVCQGLNLRSSQREARKRISRRPALFYNGTWTPADRMHPQARGDVTAPETARVVHNYGVPAPRLAFQRACPKAHRLSSAQSTERVHTQLSSK